jgi:MFS family permease
VQLGPLSSRNFRLLLASQVISMLGTGMAAIAMPFAVLSIGGTVLDVGYVIASSTIAMMTCLLLGGVVADRLPRHRAIVAADGSQAVVQAVAAVLILTHHAQVWELVALAVLRGAGFGFYMPAAQGLLPQTVIDKQLSQANAISSIGYNTAQIGGAAIGGVVVGSAGPGWGLAADAASFAVAGLLRVWMRFDTLPSATARNVLKELHEGWCEFISRRWLWVIVLQFSGVAAISIGAITVLSPTVARTHLGGARSWGRLCPHMQPVLSCVGFL